MAFTLICILDFIKHFRLKLKSKVIDSIFVFNYMNARVVWPVTREKILRMCVIINKYLYV